MGLHAGLAIAGPHKHQPGLGQLLQEFGPQGEHLTAQAAWGGHHPEHQAIGAGPGRRGIGGQIAPAKRASPREQGRIAHQGRGRREEAIQQQGIDPGGPIGEALPSPADLQRRHPGPQQILPVAGGPTQQIDHPIPPLRPQSYHARSGGAQPGRIDPLGRDALGREGLGDGLRRPKGQAQPGPLPGQQGKPQGPLPKRERFLLPPRGRQGRQGGGKPLLSRRQRLVNGPGGGGIAQMGAHPAHQAGRITQLGIGQQGRHIHQGRQGAIRRLQALLPEELPQLPLLLGRRRGLAGQGGQAGSSAVVALRLQIQLGQKQGRQRIGRIGRQAGLHAGGAELAPVQLVGQQPRQLMHRCRGSRIGQQGSQVGLRRLDPALGGKQPHQLQLGRRQEGLGFPFPPGRRALKQGHLLGPGEQGGSGFPFPLQHRGQGLQLLRIGGQAGGLQLAANELLGCSRAAALQAPFKSQLQELAPKPALLPPIRRRRQGQLGHQQLSRLGGALFALQLPEAGMESLER